VTHDAAIAALVDRTLAIRDGRTSTETVRRDAPLAAGSGNGGASAVIGLPGETHRESIVIDRVGRLQLPREAVERIAFHGRADVRILGDHVELWPLGEGISAESPVDDAVTAQGVGEAEMEGTEMEGTEMEGTVMKERTE